MLIGRRALIFHRLESASPVPTNDIFNLVKDNDEEDAQVKVQAQDSNSEQISAADYDPSLDRREDERRRVLAVNDKLMPEVETVEEEEEEEEDVDDMFAAEKRKVRKIKKIIVCPPSTFIVIPLTLFTETRSASVNYHDTGFSC
jgi:serine/threonine-protein kinase PRP4